jgi:Protein of unknown function (DUF2934)
MAKKKSKKTEGAAPAAPQKKTAKAAKKAKSAAVADPAPAKAAAPTEAQISARAHQIWIGKGSPKPGTPLADWLQAERELRA